MENSLNRRQTLLSTIAAATLAILPNNLFANSLKDIMKKIKAPKAKKIRKTISQLGRTRIDDYGWLRADNWQEVLDNPKSLPQEIRTHLDEENKYSDEILINPTKDLREKLVAEMRGRIKEDDSTPPLDYHKFSYYRRYRTGGQFPIIARKPIGGESEQILLDGDVAAKGLPFWRLLDWNISEDENIFATSVDFEGARNATITFFDAQTGKAYPEKLVKTTGELVFAKDNKTCFYVQNDDNVRPVKVMRHIIGTDPATDALVYEEKDHAYFLGLGASNSGDYLFLICSSHGSSECQYLPLDNPTALPKLIKARESDFEYYPDHHGEYFYFRTNANGAKDYKIVRAPIAAPNYENWQDFVVPSAGTLLEGFNFFENHMVRDERVKALPRITIRKMDDGSEHQIEFKEAAFEIASGASLLFKTSKMRFSYESPTTPSQIYDYDMNTKARTLIKTQEVPSGHNPSDYVVERVYAPSTSGAQVPVTLLYKKGTKLDGTAPAYLYGYGAYGIIIPDGFSTNIYNLVNRGFVTAIAHIRGGMENGFNWYEDGKMRNKRHSFDDFIAAAKTLIEKKYTSKGRIVAEGRSAGGLLMGGISNMAPELFSGIIAGVAFVDLMNTISDETLPLTPPEWVEWGDPIRNEGDYDYMYSYSPYDNVSARTYPPIFAQTALSDSQVTYWEPAKWIARLRDSAPDAGPFLLHVNMEAGHGGSPGRFDRLKEIAQSQAFALMVSKHF